MSKVILQQRDRLVIEALLERGWETIDHLHSRHFTGLSRKRALNRLRDLCRASHLERFDCDTFDSPDKFHSVYRLTKRTRSDGLWYGTYYTRLPIPAAPLYENPIPTQIAINRVGDWLGTRFVSAEEAALPDGRRRELPQAVYLADEPIRGRDIVFVVIGGGPHSYEREQVRYFLFHPRGRTLIWVSDNRREASAFEARVPQAYEWCGDRIQHLYLDGIRAHWHAHVPHVHERHRPQPHLAVKRGGRAG